MSARIWKRRRSEKSYRRDVKASFAKPAWGGTALSVDDLARAAAPLTMDDWRAAMDSLLRAAEAA